MSLAIRIFVKFGLVLREGVVACRVNLHHAIQDLRETHMSKTGGPAHVSCNFPLLSCSNFRNWGA
jgi:hypothetical protein